MQFVVYSESERRSIDREKKDERGDVRRWFFRT